MSLKKKGAVHIDKMSYIFIGSAFLIIVLFGIFLLKPLSYFNLLPSFDDVFIEPHKLTINRLSSGIGERSYDFLRANGICEKIGELRKQHLSKVLGGSVVDVIYLNGKQTNFYICGEKNSEICIYVGGTLGVDRGASVLGIGLRDSVGKIILPEGSISINDRYIELAKKRPETIKKEIGYDGDLSALEIIDLLDGAYYRFGSIDAAHICRMVDFNEEIVKIAIEYAKDNLIRGGKCLCGDNCDAYAEAISVFSAQNEIDPLLLFSLMHQESKCQNNLVSSDGSSVGLMQINTVFESGGERKGHCGSFGLPSNPEKCRELLKSDYVTNIRVGAEILKSYYTDEIIDYTCSSFSGEEQAISERYTGWDAAIRRYNGLGCSGFRRDGTRIYADHFFVEKILEIYKILINVVYGTDL